MGSNHGQNKIIVDMAGFEVYDGMKEEIADSIRKTKSNKVPKTDGFHNEMPKIDMDLSTKFLSDI